MILKHLILALWHLTRGRWRYDFATGEYVSLRRGKRRPLTAREERAIAKQLRKGGYVPYEFDGKKLLLGAINAVVIISSALFIIGVIAGWWL